MYHCIILFLYLYFVVYSSFLDENAVVSVNIYIPIATRLPWLQTHQWQCLITVQLFLNYIKHHRFMTNLLTIHIFHAFYQLLLWTHVYIAFLKNKVIAQLPWKQVSGNFFSNCAACVTASCITLCFILFVVTSYQSYRNDVYAILTENRHFVTMATGKPLKLLLNSLTSITTSCCHTLVEVIRFFVALSLHFHESRFWRPFL